MIYSDQHINSLFLGFLNDYEQISIQQANHLFYNKSVCATQKSINLYRKRDESDEIIEGEEVFLTWPIPGVFSHSAIGLNIIKKPFEPRIFQVGRVFTQDPRERGIFDKGCSV